MKEILRNADYDPDIDDNKGHGTVPQFRTLLTVVLMARHSQAMECLTGSEREGWLAAAQKELNSFKQKNVFEELDPSELPKGKDYHPDEVGPC